MRKLKVAYTNFEEVLKEKDISKIYRYFMPKWANQIWNLRADWRNLEFRLGVNLNSIPPFPFEGNEEDILRIFDNSHPLSQEDINALRDEGTLHFFYTSREKITNYYIPFLQDFFEESLIFRGVRADVAKGLAENNNFFLPLLGEGLEFMNELEELVKTQKEEDLYSLRTQYRGSLRKVKIASEIKAPEQGVIIGEGFISPKGEIFDLTANEEEGKPNLRHGDWIVENKDWLESKGYRIKFPAGLNIDSPGIMSGKVNDMLRDQLVRQGWIHIFATDIISVWKFNARVEKKIRDLIRSYDYLIDSEEITVYEQSTDAVYKIDLQESEDA